MPDDDTPVLRYLSLSAVITTMKTGRLRLTRVDKFQDPFEGSVPKQQIDQQLLIFGAAASLRRTMTVLGNPGTTMSKSPEEDDWTRTTRLRKARTRSAHASCWSLGVESEPLWRANCHDGGRGVGVAMRTTLARLRTSVAAHGLIVSPINYRQYREGPPFTKDMEALLTKRLNFKAEGELRLLKFNDSHYNALARNDASVSELPDHVCVDWVLSDVIEKILISPYADENYEWLVRLAIGAADPNLVVELSELHERRNPPLYRFIDGEISGVIGLGGANGTNLVCSIMRA
jgi:hypothetical protein